MCHRHARASIVFDRFRPSRTVAARRTSVALRRRLERLEARGRATEGPEGSTVECAVSADESKLKFGRVGAKGLRVLYGGWGDRVRFGSGAAARRARGRRPRHDAFSTSRMSLAVSGDANARGVSSVSYRSNARCDRVLAVAVSYPRVALARRRRFRKRVRFPHDAPCARDGRVFFVSLRPSSLSVRALPLAARSRSLVSRERRRGVRPARAVGSPTSRERSLLHRHEHERGKHDLPRPPDADRGRARGRRVPASSPCAALASNETVESSWS